jgi:hypothetical protein
MTNAIFTELPRSMEFSEVRIAPVQLPRGFCRRYAVRLMRSIVATPYPEIPFCWGPVTIDTTVFFLPTGPFALSPGPVFGAPWGYSTGAKPYSPRCLELDFIQSVKKKG